MPAFNTQVPTLVLRLEQNSVHHGALGAIRSLGRAGVEVHAATDSAPTSVAKSRFLSREHLLPLGPVDTENFVDVLVRISDQVGRRAVLISMDNASAIYTAAHSPELTSRFFFPSQPAALPTRIADKAELAALCAEAGIAHPLTVVPRTSAEAGDAACRLGLPLIAKWSRPWLLPPDIGLRSVSLLHSPNDAQTLFARRQVAGSQLLLQRWLPEYPGSDWFFHGYFSNTSRCLFGGSGRKELSWPINAGLTAKGSWQPNIKVEEASMEFASTISYQGALDLDFRRDEFTGTYQLLDVNPRPGAQFRLFTAADGLDIVRSLYLDLTGQKVPCQSITPGRIFVAENYALMSAASYGWRSATTGIRSGIKEGGIETAWFARDDLRPFYAMARTSLGRSLAKSVTRACGMLASHKPAPVSLPVRPPRQREPSDH